LQSLEAGWIVYQNLNGDWVPHLFTYYTTNGYSEDGDGLGGYNQDVLGWRQYDSNIFPGALIVGTSTYEGGQVGIGIKYQLYEGNWWFQVQGRWIGFYPTDLWVGELETGSLMPTGADYVAFGGEVFSSLPDPRGTFTEMGSGLRAELGWQQACYLNNLRVQRDSDGSMNVFIGSSITADDKLLFDIMPFMDSKTNWNSYLYAGGPSAGVVVLSC
jgi:hypothetical protein